MAKRATPKPAETDDVLAAVEAVEPQTAETVLTEPPVEPAPVMEPAIPPAPEPARAPSPAAPPPRRGGGGLIAALLGGVLAAAAGFGLSRVVPDGWPIRADTTALDAAVAAQADEIAALKAEFARLSATPAPDPALAERLAAVEAAVAEAPAAPDFAPVENRIALLEERLAAIEAMPADAGGASSAAQAAAIASLRSELAALKGSGANAAEGIAESVAAAEAKLAEVTSAAEALTARVAAETRAALARAAVGRIAAAAESGTPFAGALGDLEGVEIPPALSAAAATGIPTLAALRDSFPAAARAALEASLHADMGETWTDRVTSFLRSQTGARSLTPREGTDPDAVLSRAEAALAAGDLTATLAELSGLPPAGQEAMAPWIAEAEARVAGTAAIAALSATVDGQ